jgi:hypothetical protein
MFTSSLPPNFELEPNLKPSHETQIHLTHHSRLIRRDFAHVALTTLITLMRAA